MLLLSAPLVELAVHFGRTDPAGDDDGSRTVLRRSRPQSDHAARLVAVLELRLGQDATESEISATLAKVALSPEAADVIRRWALGEIDFVKMPALRLAALADAPGADRLPPFPLTPPA